MGRRFYKGDYIDITGKKFGLLSVVSIIDKDNRISSNAFWKCRCDCGNESIVNGSKLRAGEIKSCGCLSKKTNRNHPHWKGYEDISSSVFGRIKNCAKKRKILFNITIQQIWELFLKQNKTCVLTGLPLNFPSRNEKFDGTASLDRIDSTRGYIDGNIQWVHKDVNFMKQQLSTHQLVEYSKLIYFNSIK